MMVNNMNGKEEINQSLKLSDARSTIESDIKSQKVLVISESWCPIAQLAKGLLKTKGVKPKIHELDKMEEVGRAMKMAVQEITG